MKLFYAVTPNSRKVRAVAAYLGVPLEYELLDLSIGAHKRPEYLAINPMGRVPTLWDGASYIWESNAIACRLAIVAGSDLWPKDERQIEVMRWLSWDSEHFKPAIGTYFVENLLKPYIGASPDQSALESAAVAFDQLSRILDEELKMRHFITGNKPTVADFALATFFPYAEQIGLPLARIPNVVAWHDRMTKLAGYMDPFSGIR